MSKYGLYGRRRRNPVAAFFALLLAGVCILAVNLAWLALLVYVIIKVAEAAG
jgi:hypothetical protein